MGGKGHRKRMLARQQQQQQPPPPTAQLQQQPPPPRLGSGVGAAPHQPPPPPPPVRSQHPGGPGRQPTKHEGVANRTWLECSNSFLAQASNLIDEKNKAQALRSAKTFAKRFQDSPLASHLAGRVQADGGEAESARERLLHAAELEPKCPGIAFSLASLHASMGQFGLAADVCRRALAVTIPCDPALHAVHRIADLNDGRASRIRIALAKDRLRLLLAQVKHLPKDATAIRDLFRTMTDLQQQDLLKVRVDDMLAHLEAREPGLKDSFESGLQFHKETRSWTYLICPLCKSLCPTSKMFASHVKQNHLGGLEECIPYVPERPTAEQGDFLRSWKFLQGPDVVDTQKKKIQDDVMRKLIQLNDNKVLPRYFVENMMKGCNRDNDSGQLREMELLNDQTLHTLASRLQLVQRSPFVLAHEKSCKDVHVTLEGTMMSLLFTNERNETNTDVDPDVLFNWVYNCVNEKSHSIDQECAVKGAEIFRGIEGLISSLEELVKSKQNLKDKGGDYFCQEAFTDVDMLRLMAEIEYMKNRLDQVCSFDYHEIILVAMRSFLNVKLRDLIQCAEADKKLQLPTKLSYAGAVNKSKDDAEDEDKDVQKNFLKFLQGYKCRPTETPFYKGELKAMLYRKSTTFCVYYKHIEENNFLRERIARSYGRIEPLLNAALVDFIVELEMEREYKTVSNSYPRVHIYDLPRQSIQSLELFLGNSANVLVKRVHIGGEIDDYVVVTTELGKSLFLGFLQFMIENHRKGKSWNGELCIDDLQVVDRCNFEISREASKRASPNAMANDLLKLSQLLMGYYRTSDLQWPVYFRQLEYELRTCIENLDRYTSPKTISFQDYLLSHLALKSAMARGHLFLDLYRVHQALGKDDLGRLRKILASTAIDWVPDAEKHPLLEKVLHYKRESNSENENEKKTKKAANVTQNEATSDQIYRDNLEHVLLFIRHVAQHGPDHSKVNDQQKLKRLTETDLLIAKYLSDAALQLVQTLLSNPIMEEDMFAGVWTHFRSSR